MYVVFFHSGNTFHLEHATMMVDSVRHHRPDAEVVMITDPDTVALKDVDMVYRRPISKETLIYDKLKAWAEFVDAHIEEERPFLFLDTDILINDGALFVSTDHDVALTWRDDMGDFSKKMPYNAGVVHANPTAGAMRFFHDLVQMGGREEMRHHWNWYVDQLSMAQMVGKPETDGLIPRIKDCLAYRIGMYPCELYNYSPNNVWEDISGKRILHYKGNRKPIMRRHYGELFHAAPQSLHRT